MRHLLLASLALAGLAACAHDQNLSVASVHQPVVATTDLVILLNGNPRGLAPGEAERLSGYLAGIGLGRSDRVGTDAPAGPARDAVARVVGESGLLLAADLPAGPMAAGGWRVVVSRATVSMSGCPDWAHSQVTPSSPALSRNYGCATNATFAATLDDPRDLLRGRDAGSVVDPRVSVRAVQVWRDNVPSGKAALTRSIVQEAATGGAGGK